MTLSLHRQTDEENMATIYKRYLYQYMSFTAWKKHTAIELDYVTLIFLLEFLQCYLTLKAIFFVFNTNNLT